MGEYKTVTINELKEGNERLCLSSLRAFNKCYECSEYEKKIKQKEGSIKIKICESRIINEIYLKKQKRLNQLEKEKNKILEQIKKIKEVLKNE